MQNPHFTRNLIKVCLDLQKEGHTILLDDFYGHGEMPYIKLGETRTYLVDTDEDGGLFVRETELIKEIIAERTGK